MIALIIALLVNIGVATGSVDASKNTNHNAKNHDGAQTSGGTGGWDMSERKTKK